MSRRVDIVVVGGGIAGVMAAAHFARYGETVLVERESALGYHSSGRSATFYHYGIGNDAVRGLTSASAAFFDAPPQGYSETPLWEQRSALFIANQETLGDLDALGAEMRRFTTTVSDVGPEEMQAIVPVLKVGEGGMVRGLLDTGCYKLDANQLLQSAARAFRQAGGSIQFNEPVISIGRDGERWIVDTPGGLLSAKILVNAAGAWADELAMLAGVKPLGLDVLRRTIIGFAPPEGIETKDWPFLKTAADEGFYMLPESGQLLASPMDVTPTDPCDAQPDEFDISLAAWRVEEATTIQIGRIATKWAGLRSFTRDKVPTAGFAPDAPGFFWLAGQGGYGLQTAPAMSRAAEAIMFGLDWPAELAERGVSAADLAPDRLFA